MYLCNNTKDSLGCWYSKSLILPRMQCKSKHATGFKTFPHWNMISTYCIMTDEGWLKYNKTQRDPHRLTLEEWPIVQWRVFLPESVRTVTLKATISLFRSWTKDPKASLFKIPKTLKAESYQAHALLSIS